MSQQEYDGWKSVFDKCKTITNTLAEEHKQEQQNSNDVNKFIEELERIERRLQALNQQQNPHGNN